VIYRDLNTRVANYQVAPKDIPLNSCSYKDPIRVSNDRVLLNHVAGIAGSGKTNTKITALSRVPITN